MGKCRSCELDFTRYGSASDGPQDWTTGAGPRDRASGRESPIGIVPPAAKTFEPRSDSDVE